MPTVPEMFPSPFLNVADIVDLGPQVVTIREVIQREIPSRGRRPVRKWIVYFESRAKGLVLCRESAEQIAAITQHPNSQDWAGQQVELWHDRSASSPDGGGGIRVRPFAKDSDQ